MSQQNIGLNSLSLRHGDLYNCIVEYFVDIPIVENSYVIEGQIKVILELGSDAKNGALDNETLLLTLLYNDVTIKSSGLSGYFEDELLEIQKKLPEGTFMKTCINCAFSDYSPFGTGLFGTMMCFRNLKQDYLNVKSKAGLAAIHDRYDSLVQETYCCTDFSKRSDGSGYRG